MKTSKVLTETMTAFMSLLLRHVGSKPPGSRGESSARRLRQNGGQRGSFITLVWEELKPSGSSVELNTGTHTHERTHTTLAGGKTNVLQRKKNEPECDASQVLRWSPEPSPASKTGKQGASAVHPGELESETRGDSLSPAAHCKPTWIGAVNPSLMHSAPGLLGYFLRCAWHEI